MTAASATQRMPPRKLTCARCGAGFDCGTGSAVNACWCMDESYRLPMPDPGAGDCLCPACLRKAAAHLAEPPRSGHEP